MRKTFLTIIVALAALTAQGQTLPVLGEWDFTKVAEGKEGRSVFEDASSHGNAFEGRVGAVSEKGVTVLKK